MFFFLKGVRTVFGNRRVFWIEFFMRYLENIKEILRQILFMTKTLGKLLENVSEPKGNFNKIL